MLDRRMVRVTLLRLRELNRETPFTLPKPLVHLLCNFVNFVLIQGQGGLAYIDLKSMLQTCPSDSILVARNIAR